ncbi:DNA/RNA non-specific endonuclease [Flavobacterium sp.]|uniref:DNA/RNA non-specific endonuclease n=1 Tax=Flavobacterium sp. TaxID=239 RepID=UPI002612C662|nr:DNA/RNA non-specific endonuclease [Flavobacterium sp.]
MRNTILKKMLLCLMISTFLISCRKEADVNSSDSVSTDTLVHNTNTFESESTIFDFLPSSTTNQIVKHKYYTLSYNEAYEQAEWVAYELKGVKSYNNYDRPFFIEDNKVKTGSADWRNYKRSGYDKGHLCPAGDMKFSKEAYDETFLTSNISPQKHNFNDGIWNTLEQKVRYWASKYNGIYVVTGGVLNKNLKTIGNEEVAVPEYFYKVLLDNSRGEYKMIGFLVPAVESNKPLYDFVVPVDEIEKLTGLDFYPKLNDGLENKLEKSNDYKSWSFN